MDTLDNFYFTGVIQKKSPAGLRLYQERFFFFDMVNGVITYYQNESEYNTSPANYSGVISLISAKEISYNGKRELLINTINKRSKPSHRTYELKFSSEESAKQWCHRISKCIASFNIPALLTGIPIVVPDSSLINLRYRGRMSVLRQEDHYELVATTTNNSSTNIPSNTTTTNAAKASISTSTSSSEPSLLDSPPITELLSQCPKLSPASPPIVTSAFSSCIYPASDSKDSQQKSMKNPENHDSETCKVETFSGSSSFRPYDMFHAQNTPQQPVGSLQSPVLWPNSGKFFNSGWSEGFLIRNSEKLMLFKSEKAYLTNSLPKMHIPVSEIVGTVSSPITPSYFPQFPRNLDSDTWYGFLLLTSSGIFLPLACGNREDRDRWLRLLTAIASVNIQRRLHMASATPPCTASSSLSSQPSQLSSSPSTIVHHGWLAKRGVGMSLKAWRDRYFVLQVDKLIYFTTVPDFFTHGSGNANEIAHGNGKSGENLGEGTKGEKGNNQNSGASSRNGNNVIDFPDIMLSKANGYIPCASIQDIIIDHTSTTLNHGKTLTGNSNDSGNPEHSGTLEKSGKNTASSGFFSTLSSPFSFSSAASSNSTSAHFHTRPYSTGPALSSQLSSGVWPTDFTSGLAFKTSELCDDTQKVRFRIITHNREFDIEAASAFDAQKWLTSLLYAWTFGLGIFPSSGDSSQQNPGLTPTTTTHNGKTTIKLPKSPSYLSIPPSLSQAPPLSSCPLLPLSASSLALAQTGEILRQVDSLSFAISASYSRESLKQKDTQPSKHSHTLYRWAQGVLRSRRARSSIYSRYMSLTGSLNGGNGGSGSNGVVAEGNDEKSSMSRPLTLRTSTNVTSTGSTVSANAPAVHGSVGVGVDAVGNNGTTIGGSVASYTTDATDDAVSLIPCSVVADMTAKKGPFSQRSQQTLMSLSQPYKDGELAEGAWFAVMSVFSGKTQGLDTRGKNLESTNGSEIPVGNLDVPEGIKHALGSGKDGWLGISGVGSHANVQGTGDWKGKHKKVKKEKEKEKEKEREKEKGREKDDSHGKKRKNDSDDEEEDVSSDRADRGRSRFGKWKEIGRTEIRVPVYYEDDNPLVQTLAAAVGQESTDIWEIPENSKISDGRNRFRASDGSPLRKRVCQRPENVFGTAAMPYQHGLSTGDDNLSLLSVDKYNKRPDNGIAVVNPHGASVNATTSVPNVIWPEFSSIIRENDVISGQLAGNEEHSQSNPTELLDVLVTPFSGKPMSAVSQSQQNAGSSFLDDGPGSSSGSKTLNLSGKGSSLNPRNSGIMSSSLPPTLRNSTATTIASSSASTNNVNWSVPAPLPPHILVGPAANRFRTLLSLNVDGLPWNKPRTIDDIIQEILGSEILDEYSHLCRVATALRQRLLALQLRSRPSIAAPTSHTWAWVTKDDLHAFVLKYPYYRHLVESVKAYLAQNPMLLHILGLGNSILSVLHSRHLRLSPYYDPTLAHLYQRYMSLELAIRHVLSVFKKTYQEGLKTWLGCMHEKRGKSLHSLRQLLLRSKHEAKQWMWKQMFASAPMESNSDAHGSATANVGNGRSVDVTVSSSTSHSTSATTTNTHTNTAVTNMTGDSGMSSLQHASTIGTTTTTTCTNPASLPANTPPLRPLPIPRPPTTGLHSNNTNSHTHAPVHSHLSASSLSPAHSSCPSPATPTLTPASASQPSPSLPSLSSLDNANHNTTAATGTAAGVADGNGIVRASMGGSATAASARLPIPPAPMSSLSTHNTHNTQAHSSQSHAGAASRLPVPPSPSLPAHNTTTSTSAAAAAGRASISAGGGPGGGGQGGGSLSSPPRSSLAHRRTSLTASSSVSDPHAAMPIGGGGGVRVARDFWKNALNAINREKKNPGMGKGENVVVEGEENVNTVVVEDDNNCNDDGDDEDIDVVEWLAWAWAPLLTNNHHSTNDKSNIHRENNVSGRFLQKNSGKPEDVDFSHFSTLPADFAYILPDLMPFPASTTSTTSTSIPTSISTALSTDMNTLLHDLQQQTTKKVGSVLQATQDQYAGLSLTRRSSQNTLSSSLLSSLRDQLSSEEQDAWKYGSDEVLDRTLVKISIYQAKPSLDYHSSIDKCMEIGSIICTIGDILRQPGGVLRKKCVFLFGKDSRAEAHVEVAFMSCQPQMLSSSDRYMYHNTMLPAAEYCPRDVQTVIMPTSTTTNFTNSSTTMTNSPDSVDVDDRYAPISSFISKNSLPNVHAALHPSNALTHTHSHAHSHAHAHGVSSYLTDHNHGNSTHNHSLTLLSRFTPAPTTIHTAFIPRYYMLLTHESLQTSPLTFSVPLQIVTAALRYRQRQYCYLYQCWRKVLEQLNKYKGMIGENPLMLSPARCSNGRDGTRTKTSTHAATAQGVYGVSSVFGDAGDSDDHKHTYVQGYNGVQTVDINTVHSVCGCAELGVACEAVNIAQNVSLCQTLLGLEGFIMSYDALGHLTRCANDVSAIMRAHDNTAVMTNHGDKLSMLSTSDTTTVDGNEKNRNLHSNATSASDVRSPANTTDISNNTSNDSVTSGSSPTVNASISRKTTDNSGMSEEAVTRITSLPSSLSSLHEDTYTLLQMVRNMFISEISYWEETHNPENVNSPEGKHALSRPSPVPPTVVAKNMSARIPIAAALGDTHILAQVMAKSGLSQNSGNTVSRIRQLEQYLSQLGQIMSDNQGACMVYRQFICKYNQYNQQHEAWKHHFGQESIYDHSSGNFQSRNPALLPNKAIPAPPTSGIISCAGICEENTTSSEKSESGFSIGSYNSGNSEIPSTNQRLHSLTASSPMGISTSTSVSHNAVNHANASIAATNAGVGMAIGAGVGNVSSSCHQPTINSAMLSYFKPSTAKSDPFLDFLPTNLHQQLSKTYRVSSQRPQVPLYGGVDEDVYAWVEGVVVAQEKWEKEEREKKEKPRATEEERANQDTKEEGSKATSEVEKMTIVVGQHDDRSDKSVVVTFAGVNNNESRSPLFNPLLQLLHPLLASHTRASSASASASASLAHRYPRLRRWLSPSVEAFLSSLSSQSLLYRVITGERSNTSLYCPFDSATRGLLAYVPEMKQKKKNHPANTVTYHGLTGKKNSTQFYPSSLSSSVPSQLSSSIPSQLSSSLSSQLSSLPTESSSPSLFHPSPSFSSSSSLSHPHIMSSPTPHPHITWLATTTVGAFASHANTHSHAPTHTSSKSAGLSTQTHALLEALMSVKTAWESYLKSSTMVLRRAMVNATINNRTITQLRNSALTLTRNAAALASTSTSTSTSAVSNAAAAASGSICVDNANTVVTASPTDDAAASGAGAEGADSEGASVIAHDGTSHNTDAGLHTPTATNTSFTTSTSASHATSASIAQARKELYAKRGSGVYTFRPDGTLSRQFAALNPHTMGTNMGVSAKGEYTGSGGGDVDNLAMSVGVGAGVDAPSSPASPLHSNAKPALPSSFSLSSLPASCTLSLASLTRTLTDTLLPQLNKLELSLSSHHRRAVPVFSQALTSVLTNIAAVLCVDDSAQLDMIGRTGWLVPVESLLTATGAEYNMLTDLEWASHALSQVKVRVVCSENDCGWDFFRDTVNFVTEFIRNQESSPLDEHYHGRKQSLSGEERRLRRNVFGIGDDGANSASDSDAASTSSTSTLASTSTSTATATATAAISSQLQAATLASPPQLLYRACLARLRRMATQGTTSAGIGGGVDSLVLSLLGQYADVDDMSSEHTPTVTTSTSPLDTALRSLTRALHSLLSSSSLHHAITATHTHAWMASTHVTIAPKATVAIAEGPVDDVKGVTQRDTLQRLDTVQRPDAGHQVIGEGDTITLTNANSNGADHAAAAVAGTGPYTSPSHSSAVSSPRPSPLLDAHACLPLTSPSPHPSSLDVLAYGQHTRTTQTSHIGIFENTVVTPSLPAQELAVPEKLRNLEFFRKLAFSESNIPSLHENDVDISFSRQSSIASGSLHGYSTMSTNNSNTTNNGDGSTNTSNSNVSHTSNHTSVGGVSVLSALVEADEDAQTSTAIGGMSGLTASLQKTGLKASTSGNTAGVGLGAMDVKNVVSGEEDDSDEDFFIGSVFDTDPEKTSISGKSRPHDPSEDEFALARDRANTSSAARIIGSQRQSSSRGLGGGVGVYGHHGNNHNGSGAGNAVAFEKMVVVEEEELSPVADVNNGNNDGNSQIGTSATFLNSENFDSDEEIIVRDHSASDDSDDDNLSSDDENSSLYDDKLHKMTAGVPISTATAPLPSSASVPSPTPSPSSSFFTSPNTRKSTNPHPTSPTSPLPSSNLDLPSLPSALTSSPTIVNIHVPLSLFLLLPDSITGDKTTQLQYTTMNTLISFLATNYPEFYKSIMNPENQFSHSANFPNPGGLSPSTHPNSCTTSAGSALATSPDFSSLQLLFGPLLSYAAKLHRRSHSSPPLHTLSPSSSTSTSPSTSASASTSLFSAPLPFTDPYVHSPLLSLTCPVVTQGVNEFVVMAGFTGQVQKQHSINIDACAQLLRFADRYVCALVWKAVEDRVGYGLAHVQCPCSQGGLASAHGHGGVGGNCDAATSVNLNTTAFGTGAGVCPRAGGGGVAIDTVSSRTLSWLSATCHKHTHLPEKYRSGFPHYQNSQSEEITNSAEKTAASAFALLQSLTCPDCMLAVAQAHHHTHRDVHACAHPVAGNMHAQTMHTPAFSSSPPLSIFTSPPPFSPNSPLSPLFLSTPNTPTPSLCRCSCHLLDVCTCTKTAICVACEYDQHIATIFAKIAYIEQLAKALRERISAATKVSDRKDVMIHVLAANLCRALGAARVVSCKSAKDRTSMSVTWELVRVLHRLGVHMHELPSFLTLLRTFGVRRANVIKNTGKKKYAFNGFQRSMLPDVLTPPPSTCSGKTES